MTPPKPPLRIAYCLRNDAFTKGGGDSGKVEKYSRSLVAMGHDPLIFTSARELRQEKGRIDLIHIFNTQTPYENHPYYAHARERGIPVVFSPIHHQKAFMEQYFRELSPVGRMNYQIYMYLSSVAKQILVKRKLPTAAWLHSPDGINRKILRLAEAILPLSESENKHMTEDLGMTVPDSRVQIIPNALTFNESKPIPREIDVVVVGRIEPRKNMLKIAEALAASNYSATFIGMMNSNHAEYGKKFEEVIARSPNLSYAGKLKQEDLAGYYRRSKVCLSNSWFEVVSQVDLEAVSLGCKPVISKASAIQDYFEGDVISLLPDCSSQEILSAVDSAMTHDYHPRLKASHTRDWPAVTADLVEVYQRVRDERVGIAS